MNLNLLIIDTETTGLDPSEHQVIEVAAILYSVAHQTTIHQLSTLLRAPGENPQEKVNRIPAAALPAVSPVIQQHSIQMLLEMARESDLLVAHNADFDKQWFDGQQLPVLLKQSGEPLPWLCTMEDFHFPRQNRPGQSLINTALEHGIGVSSAHRALTDCQLIAALFDRLDNLPGVVWEAMRHGLRPKAIYTAQVSYENRELAKDAGFRWNQIVPGAWAKKMASEEISHLPFGVMKVRDC